MIDLHCHILPNVDDGPATLEEAVALCQHAAAQGITAMVATPHQRHPHFDNTDRGELEEKLTELRQEIGELLRLELGGEVRIDNELLLASSLDDLGVNRLADTRYLLLEWGRTAEHPTPEDAVYELRLAGIQPIIAHPECLLWLAHDLGRVADLIDLGALMQVTATSVVGDFGLGPSESVHRMLRAGLVHFVASDCHDIEHRPPLLAQAYDEITTRCDRDLADLLTLHNPAAVLENRALVAA